MAYATALLLLPFPSVRIGNLSNGMCYRKGLALLPAVFAQPNPILHAQAYLSLALHALHKSSTRNVISLASTTIKYCIQQQFHLAETEPAPVTPAVRLENQTRRRCFWCAYKMDRLMVSSFELPPSIPDAMITAREYSNINDSDLLAVAAETAPEFELPDAAAYTSVSSPLSILQCRRIQSEIACYTLRGDYELCFEKASDWRVRILAELENYKLRVQKFADPNSKGYASKTWLAMIYHYTLLMLYRPNKANVLEQAGDWSVQASCHACLIFRKTQMDRQVAQPWLGLLVQFQSGVTLLYCFWATPPQRRTKHYDSPDVSDAVRACSNTLAIMADRWATADTLRDIFELLAREVPLVDNPNCPPRRLSDKSAKTIREKLVQARALVIHRPTLRMIEEMITEDFPRGSTSSAADPMMAGQADVMPDPDANALASTPTAQTMLDIVPRFSATDMFHNDGEIGVDEEDLGADSLLTFPGIFDYS